MRFEPRSRPGRCGLIRDNVLLGHTEVGDRAEDGRQEERAGHDVHVVARVGPVPEVEVVLVLVVRVGVGPDPERVPSSERRVRIG